jgi:hypothetical protein
VSLAPAPSRKVSWPRRNHSGRSKQGGRAPVSIVRNAQFGRPTTEDRAEVIDQVNPRKNNRQSSPAEALGPTR